MKNYDLIVIGGGAGGLVSAKLAAGMGKRVLIIEKKKIGGDCTLTGCVPSKTLIKSAKVAHHIKNSKNFGITHSVSSINTDNVMSHVKSVVDKIYNTHTPEKLESEGIEVIIGSPSFIDNNTVIVNEQKISSKKFVLATGSRPLIPPIDGLTNYLTNESLFNLDKLPESIIIIGGGPIGVEMASALNYLGVDVSIVEMQDSILSKEEPTLSNMLKKTLASRGIKIFNNTKVVKVQGSKVFCEGEVNELEGESLLVAIGRRPNLEDLNLDKAGVKYDKQSVIVDEYLATNAKNIYACGDIVGLYLFSHVSEHQAMCATQNALLPFRKKFDSSNISWVTFASPELASLGLTEQEARKRYGNSIRVYEQEYSKVDRAICDGNELGIGKFICDKRGNLLGAHILGERAGEIIHELILLKAYRKNFSRLHWIIHPYPTYNELIKKASRKAYIDIIGSKFIVRLAKRFFGGKK